MKLPGRGESKEGRISGLPDRWIARCIGCYAAGTAGVLEYRMDSTICAKYGLKERRGP